MPTLTSWIEEILVMEKPLDPLLDAAQNHLVYATTPLSSLNAAIRLATRRVAQRGVSMAPVASPDGGAEMRFLPGGDLFKWIETKNRFSVAWVPSGPAD